jgi:flagellar hook-length control protein FliK
MTMSALSTLPGPSTATGTAGAGPASSSSGASRSSTRGKGSAHDFADALRTEVGDSASRTRTRKHAAARPDATDAAALQAADGGTQAAPPAPVGPVTAPPTGAVDSATSSSATVQPAVPTPGLASMLTGAVVPTPVVPVLDGQALPAPAKVATTATATATSAATSAAPSAAAAVVAAAATAGAPAAAAGTSVPAAPAAADAAGAAAAGAAGPLQGFTAAAVAGAPAAGPGAPAPVAATAPVVVATAEAGSAAAGQAHDGDPARHDRKGGTPAQAAAAPVAGSAPAALPVPGAVPASGGDAPTPPPDVAAVVAPSTAVRTEATAPAVVAPRVDPAPLAQQLAPSLQTLKSLGNGQHVMTLNVTPEHLGPVRVTAHISAEGVRIELVGATQESREALRQSLTDLKRDLAGAGLKADLSLGSGSTDSDGPAWQSRDGAWQAQDGARAGARRPTVGAARSGTSTTSDSSPAARTTARIGSLDLTL